MELVAGMPIDAAVNLPQGVRDHVSAWYMRWPIAHAIHQIGSSILQLCLNELFVFGMMQTDPNFANFLYDPAKNKVSVCGAVCYGQSRAH